MTKTRILLFGAHGQVGRALAAARPAAMIALAREQADLSKDGAVVAEIHRHKPTVVINAAAYTAVDAAESNSELAYRINAEAPREMARAAADVGAALIHYSTDYVFDGSAKKPYIESDPTAPLGVYGKSKLAGEVGITESTSAYVILRTAWVYDRTGKNFLTTMLRLAEDPARSELNVVADQRGSPTFASDLANATLAIVDQLDTDNDDRFGIYHATGGGETSWHGFAEEIFATAGKPMRVNPITTAEYPTPAPRPAYSVLDNNRLATRYEIGLPSWQDALARCLGAGKSV